MKKEITIGLIGLVLLGVLGWGAYTMFFKKSIAQDGGPVTDSPSELTLKIGEEKRFDDLIVALAAVTNDSRCPEDVSCVTAGTVTVKLSLRVADASEEVTYTSGTDAHWFAGYYVAIVRALPAVRSNEVIDPSTYRVTLHIIEGRKPGVYAPAFEDYRVSEFYTGVPATFDIGAHPELEDMEEEITEALADGPAYAGKYVVVKSPCGEHCIAATIIDASAGTVLAREIPSRFGFQYATTSSLFIVNPKTQFGEADLATLTETTVNVPLGAVPAYADHYAITDGAFKLVGRFNVRTDELLACGAESVLVKHPLTGEESEVSSSCMVPYGFETIERKPEALPAEYEKNGFKLRRFMSEEQKVSFDYIIDPEGYTLTEPEVAKDDKDGLIASFVLMNTKEYEELKASTEPREGPPTISVHVYDNADGLTIEAWALAHQTASNYFADRSKLIPMKIGQRDGMLYNADGLYPSSNAIVIVGDKLYLISGSYRDRTERIYGDFEAVTSSMAFIEAQPR